MKVSFLGAAREVTGSAILIESAEANFLVDFGMFQGLNSYAKNMRDFNFDPKKIDFVLLTHAHLDHSGRLPKLCKEGFSGKVFSTEATRDLAEIILLDSVSIFEKDGRPPLYKYEDVSSLLKLFQCYKYGDSFEFKNIKIKLNDAGHILGSTIFEVFVEGKKLVFSGDLGNNNAPIIKDTDFIDSGDIVFVESTYGGLIHKQRSEGVKELLSAINEVIDKNSVLLIPSFSIERTQELLFEINNFVESKKISNINIFLDSPLAIKATKIYKGYKNIFDKESIKLINGGDDIFDFEGLKETEKAKDSFRIIKTSNPKIIIAGSGMCSGGRMPFYIKHYGKDKNNIILLNSYQAEGTVGRKIENGEQVFINEVEVPILAQVKKIDSFSSHADSLKIKEWVANIKPKKVFINHGDYDRAEALHRDLKDIIDEVVISELEKTYLL
ncbi:MAG: MBL fold metallo-hydrolase [Candidatus Pacebacteria bacterium]|nr:MBL fold metallo-hydrolase [Candidatus Paceibacterota bacterium]